MELIPALRQLGIGLMPYSPLHAGLLAGAIEAATQGHTSDDSMRNPVVSTAIVGAMTIEELRWDLGALSVRVDDEVAERLDRIWPGPGEAPQAYAW